MARLTVLCGTGMTELATSTEGAEVETFCSFTDITVLMVRSIHHTVLSIAPMSMLQLRFTRPQSSVFGV